MLNLHKLLRKQLDCLWKRDFVDMNETRGYAPSPPLYLAEKGTTRNKNVFTSATDGISATIVFRSSHSKERRNESQPTTTTPRPAVFPPSRHPKWHHSTSYDRLVVNPTHHGSLHLVATIPRSSVYTEMTVIGLATNCLADTLFLL